MAPRGPARAVVRARNDAKQNGQVMSVDLPATEAADVGAQERRSPPAWFEALYRAELNSITAFFSRRSRNPLTVADLTADTFLEALRSYRTFDPARGQARPWLYGIARDVYARRRERDLRIDEAGAPP